MNISNETFNEVKSVAHRWQSLIQKSRESEEERFHDMMNKMLEDPMNKIFLIELLDQSFRSKDTDRVADQLAYIFAKHENTEFFSSFEQILIWLFRHVGIYVSSISIPLFIQYLRNDVSGIIIKGENNPLIKHIKHRRKEGTRVNINIIGDADQALYIASDPFISHGRIELMHYFIEQSISDSYHRYGNLGQKGILSKQGE